MAGNIPPEGPKDIFKAGHAFEAALAYLYREEHPDWQLSPGEVQIRRDGLGFPCLATLDRRARKGRARRVVEFKIARSLEEWGDPDLDGEIPADYAAQVLMQMLITGYTAHPGHVMVMGPYFRHRVYEIVWDPELAAVIVEACRAWVASLEEGAAPDLDDSVPTYEAVRALHDGIDGSTAVLEPDLAADWLEAGAALKAAKARAQGLQTRVLFEMGHAQYGEAGGARVSRRQHNGRGGISLYPANKISADELRSQG
jgi:hypothetical protein